MIAGLDGFDVRKIDDLEYTVEISCYFLTKWRDDRLILHEDILKVGEVAAATEAYNGTTVEETWFPIDLEFVSKVTGLIAFETVVHVFSPVRKSYRKRKKGPQALICFST